MKKIADILLKNIGWKLLSLALAVVLWFVGLNVTDPTTTRRFPVGLTILNKDSVEQSQLILLNEAELEREEISILVRAAKSELDRLWSERDSITAYIDLKPIDVSYADKVGEPQSLNVMVKLPDFISDDRISSIDPPNVEILLDDYVEQRIPITVEPVGTPEEGYLNMTPVVNPNAVTVRGAKSEVSRIESVRVQVDLQDVDTTIDETANIMILDDDKADITNQFEVDIKRTHVTVQIYKYKSVPVKAFYMGNLASEYRVASITRAPETVQVVGNEEDLNSLTEIELKPYVNLDGASSTFSKTYDVRQLLIDTNPNLSIRNNTPHEVTVTVNIEKETVREIAVPLEKLHFIGVDYAVDLPSGVTEVNLGVRGAAVDVDKITADNVNGTVDLTGLSPGEHEVIVSFDLPKDVTQLGEPIMLTVIISEPMETPVPEEPDVNDTD